MTNTQSPCIVVYAYDSIVPLIISGGDREAPGERGVLHRARQGGPARVLRLHHVGRGLRAQVLARVLHRLHGQDWRDPQGRLRGVHGGARLIARLPPGSCYRGDQCGLTRFTVQILSLPSPNECEAGSISILYLYLSFHLKF